MNKTCRVSAGSPLALAAALLVLVGSTGCLSSTRMFTVMSYPPGATIFVDQVERGQTDTERLAVEFGKARYRSLRVEKEGFQPEGIVLHSGIRERRIEFHLKRAPDSESVLGRLEEIQVELRRLSGQLAELRESQTRKEKPRVGSLGDAEFRQDAFGKEKLGTDD